ncbi:MAG: PilZ domain-containing protein [Azoarcus sp.]|nr:PilZ domain-containing protein [Azoarcus sp.]
MSYKFPTFVTVSFSSQSPNEARLQDKTEGESASASNLNERRIHQRFVARLRGEPCFWALIGEERLALDDLSLRGFALPVLPALVPGAQFDFVLQREGVPDAIQGRAEVVNVFGKDALSAGCRIIEFEADSAERLHDWLVTHVILNATVRINEKDAAAIVSGGSFV